MSRRNLFALSVLLLAGGLAAAGAGELVLKLKHKRPGDMAALIGPEISPGGALAADNAAMTLALREQPDRIEYFRRRIFELDIPPQPFAMGVTLGAMPAAALPAPGAAAAPPAPSEIARADRKLLEGESAEIPLDRYRLRLGLGLYDNRNRALRLSELKLFASGNPGAPPLLSLAARLKTGRATVFAVDRAGGTLVLQLTPTPLPVAPELKAEAR